jgi:ABC-type multidrug transport system fused ATPase/permease subunit
MKTKTESVIIPEIVSYARKQVIINYLKTNEKVFSDKNVERDTMKLIDFGFYFEKVFIWIIESIIPTILLIIFMNIYFLIKTPAIGIISLITNILNFVIIKSFFHKLMNVISERQKYQELVSSAVNENLSNLIDIHTNNKLNDTINTTENLLNNYKEKVKDQLELVMKFVNTLKLLNYSSNLLNIFVLYKTSTSIENFFEIFSMFILYIPIFEGMTQQIPVKLGNLNDLLLLTNYFTQNKKIIQNIEQYSSQEILENIKHIENITFDNITFKYDNNSENIISNFSLKINKNDKVAILAQSGSGKTTLMKLLLAFYKPQKGKILINNIDINNIDKKDIRNRINYINQKTLLLNDTIINNIKYGNNKPDNYIIDILKKYDLLNLFKNSINYQVDISGKNISMGMQKVIFIMRGILKDDTDVYIFDEPLTSIDKNTRKNIINLINDFCKNKTLIIITHDEEILSIVNKKFYL